MAKLIYKKCAECERILLKDEFFFRKVPGLGTFRKVCIDCENEKIVPKETTNERNRRELLERWQEYVKKPLPFYLL